MGYGNCVLTLNTPENVEVTGDAALHYRDAGDLAAQLQRVLRGGAMVTQYRQRAQARVRERYDWEHVVDEYERLFAHMAGVEPPAPAFVAADAQQAVVEKKVLTTETQRRG
jgi:glycosyltransferase involved in cell wall biosynthesis